MSSSQRIFMEVGYSTLRKAGVTRSSNASGRDVSVCCGDVGADWGGLAHVWHSKVGDPQEPYTSELGRSSILVPARLMHFLGLTGTAFSVSTVCSSSLVALSHGHHEMLDTHRAFLAGGLNTILSAGSYVAFSLNNMLSTVGRCFTYNESGDGYCRAEGVAALFAKWCDTEEEQNETYLAVLAGSYCNQDGRSASLTAPHGPSQEKLAKSAMKISGLKAAEVCVCECHGTGTALGDPIEIGALARALNNRSIPVYMTSAKSVNGHMESNAGLGGLTKCVMMVRTSATPPNCHLNSVNPHLKTDGFPVFFTTELSYIGYSSSYGGVSSFGATGTNARAEVIGLARIGPRAVVSTPYPEKYHAVMTCPQCLGDMCRLCCTAIHSNSGPHFCSSLRGEGASYDVCSMCYDGAFRSDITVDSGEGSKDTNEHLFIVGSWNAFSGTQPMVPIGGDSCDYSFVVTLGDTLREHFQIVMGEVTRRTIYPVAKNADPSVRIAGPDGGGSGMHWLIDGRRDRARAGTTYRITFSWNGANKSINWERESPPLDSSSIALTGKTGRPHRYFVTGSMNTWSLHEMRVVDLDDGVYETTVRIGNEGQEEFQIVRDRDRTQTLYPLACKTADTAVTIRGPDDNGDNMSWAIFGEYGDRVRLRLRIRDGHIRLSTTSASGDSKTWQSL